jgi:nucleoside phosphorylase
MEIFKSVVKVFDDQIEEHRDGFHCMFRKRMHNPTDQVWDCTATRDGTTVTVSNHSSQQAAFNAAVTEWQRTAAAAPFVATASCVNVADSSGTRSAARPAFNPVEVTSRFVMSRGSVLIVVAKDREYEFVRQEIQRKASAWQLMDDGFLGAGGSMAYVQYVLSGVTITIASPHNMGMVAVDSFGEMLDKFRPAYVTTIGCCGGRPDSDTRRVPIYIITEAIATGEDDLFFIQAHATAMETWRDLERHLRFVGRPDGRNRVPRDVARVVSVGSQAVVEGPTVGQQLDQYDAHCLDMEVAHLWRTVQLHNVFQRSSGLPEVVVLPAVKGYSDSGDKKERAEKMELAVRGATQFVITMVNKIAVRGGPVAAGSSSSGPSGPQGFQPTGDRHVINISDGSAYQAGTINNIRR